MKTQSLALLFPFLMLPLMSFAALAEPSGEDLYFETCALCHGDDGSGAMPEIPDLSGADGPLWKTDIDLIAIIMNGVDRSDLPTPMPAKGGNEELNPDNARSVLQFMRREFGN